MSEYTVRLGSDSNSVKLEHQNNYNTTLPGTVSPRKFIQLTDVNMIGVQNGDLVTYDETTKTFIPGVNRNNFITTSLYVSGIGTISGVTINSGTVLANEFYGNLIGIANTSIDVIGGIGSLTTLFVTGVSSLPYVYAGIITANTFYGNLIGTASTSTDVIGGIADINSLNVSGITTLNEAYTGNIQSNGIISATEFYGNLIGNVSTAVTSINVVGGIASITSLDVSGISTLPNIIGTSATIATIQSDSITASDFYGNLTGTSTTSINVIGGISSVKNLSVSGISTLGITSIANLTSQELNVSGISTLGDVAISSGIITSSNPGVTTVVYYGDGSHLIGVNAFNVVTQSNSELIVYPTFASNTGVSSVGISSEKFVFIPSSGDVGLGTTNPSSKLTVIGDGYFSGDVTATTFIGNLIGTATTSVNAVGGIGSLSSLTVSGVSTLGITSATNLTSQQLYVSGIVTAPTFVGNLTGTATTATKLEHIRTFEITGDIVALPQNFDGTQNVSLASSIQPNSVGLGTYTYGDYVKNITGTPSQIIVSQTSGEGSSPQISLSNNVTITNNLTVNNDVQISNDLNVNGNITIGGTSAYLAVNNLLIKDRDIVSGYTLDGFGNDVSTDVTANTGGIAVASTEGSPIINLNTAGIETLPPTYKKLMWFKENSFAGLNTDAWMFNYGVGVGSTQIPFGVRLAVGGVQVTDNDLVKVRNINASGIITGSSFVSSSGYFKAPDGTNAFYIYSGSGNIAFQGTISASQINNASGNKVIGFANTDVTFENNAYVNNNLYVTGITSSKNGFYGNLTGTATTSVNVVGGIGSLSSLTVSGVSTLGITSTTNLTAQQLNVSGLSTLSYLNSTNINAGSITATTFVGNFSGTATTAINVVGGIADVTSLNVSGFSTLSNVSAGIVTATQFSTGPFGIGINTNTIYGPATIIIDPYPVGDNGGVLRIKGDLYVDGTQTIINSNTLEIADLQIGIGTTAFNDVVLDGAGIGIGSPVTRKTFAWQYSTLSFKSSENINLALNKTYKINGVDVLSSNTLGSGVVNSSLTSVGTLNSLNVSGISTLPFLNSTNITAGIVTATTFIGNLTGTATTAVNVVGGIGSLSSLTVSGVSTLGITSVTNLTSQQLSVAGVSTLGFVTVGNVYSTGIITATTFSGTATTALSASTAYGLSGAPNINVGIVTSTKLVVNDGGTFTGVVTATTFNGQINSGVGTITTLTSTDITASTITATSNGLANKSVLAATGTPRVANSSYGLLGVGPGNLGFSDTDIVAHYYHNVNSYAQIIFQNNNPGNAASADIIVNNDKDSGTQYYGDFGVNSSSFAGSGPYDDSNGVYLYSAGGTLSLGTNDGFDVRIATGNATNTPTTKVTVKAVTGNVGIGTTTPSSKLTVIGDGFFSGIVTASRFVGSGSSLTDLRVGIQSSGTLVGTAGTINFTGIGISSVTVASNIATINIPATTRTKTIITAVPGQTIFPCSYTVGYVDVFFNGSKLSSSQYTAQDGANVVLIDAASANDVIEIVGYNGVLKLAGSNTVLSDVSTDGTICYIGKAAAGVSTGDPYWTIRRSLYSSVGIVTSTGVARNIAWSSRTTGIYT